MSAEGHDNAVEQERELQAHEREARKREEDERRPEERSGGDSGDDHNPQAGMQRTG